MMNDPSDYPPPGGYAPDAHICRVCGGVMPDFIGFPGEYPCVCSNQYPEYDDTEDVERWQFSKKR